MSRRPMLCPLGSSLALAAVALALTVPAAGVAQESRLASRGPRFFQAAWTGGSETDASAAPVLHRRVSLNLTSATLETALREVIRGADLEMSYSPRVVPLGRLVSIHAQGITVAAALTEILLDVPVDVSVTRGGVLALVQRMPRPPETADSGSVAGQVRDSATQAPLVGATIW